MVRIKQKIAVSVPIIVNKEGRMFVAWHPQLDIASQGDTREEAVKNLNEAMQLYLEDPDAKPFRPLQEISLEFETIEVPKEMVAGGQTSHPVG